jgi:ATP-binding cassette subfamily F protein 3
MARKLLGGFFFTGEAVDKPVHVLSGGERTRLRLAKMLFSGANALLLDEPTNHLDIASRATLENALRDYEGTVILVSHDRTFLDAVATRIVEIKDGRVRSFPGNYSDYCAALKSMGETSPLIGASYGGSNGRSAAPTSERSSDGDSSAGAKAERKEEKRKGGKPDPSKDASREQQRVKKLVAQIEKEIEGIEVKLADLEKELAKPEVYRDFTRCNPILKEKAKLQELHASFLAQWEQYAAAAES